MTATRCDLQDLTGRHMYLTLHASQITLTLGRHTPQHLMWVPYRRAEVQRGASDWRDTL
jgi:hypothetical protein